MHFTSSSWYMTFGKEEEMLCHSALQLNTPINAPGNWLPIVESVWEVMAVWVVVSSILLMGIGETVG